MLARRGDGRFRGPDAAARRGVVEPRVAEDGRPLAELEVGVEVVRQAPLEPVEVEGLSADVVRRKGLDGTRKILCMIKNAAFEDWLARHMKSLELVGRACSELKMTLLDEDDVRLCKGKGMNVDVLIRQLRNPNFDPKEGFLCMFIDPSYGPYADATLIVRWDLRFELEDR